MRTYIFLFTILIMNTADASFNNLLTEYLEKNIDLKVKKLGVESSKLGVNSLQEIRSFNLTGSGMYTDSSLDSASRMATTGSTTLYSLALSKINLSGSTFSLSNNLSGYNQNSNFSSMDSNEFFEFNQKLSATQKLGRNYLGREDKMAIKMARENVEISKVDLDNYESSLLLAFYQSYLTASLNLTSYNLQKDAYGRAQKRTKLIDKKVKDGLREKADLYQAHNDQFEQNELLKTIMVKIQDNLMSLSTMLHREVKNSEISLQKLKGFKLSVMPIGEMKDDLNFKLLKVQKIYQESALKKSEMGFIPEVELTASYKTNQYNEASTTALSDGILTGNDNELSVGVSLVMPLGYGTQKVDKALKAIELKKIEYQIKKIKVNFSDRERMLKKQVSLFDESIVLVLKRLKTSKLSLKEYNSLYNYGKADLDQVIRSEEALIRTQKSLVSYIISRELKVVELSLLYGKLKSFLMSHQKVSGEKNENFH